MYVLIKLCFKHFVISFLKVLLSAFGFPLHCCIEGKICPYNAYGSLGNFDHLITIAENHNFGRNHAHNLNTVTPQKFKLPIQRIGPIYELF